MIEAEAQETTELTWLPIAQLQPGRVVLLKVPRNSMGRRETTFCGYRFSRERADCVAVYFDCGHPRQILVDAVAFAVVQGL